MRQFTDECESILMKIIIIHILSARGISLKFHYTLSIIHVITVYVDTFCNIRFGWKLKNTCIISSGIHID